MSMKIIQLAGKMIHTPMARVLVATVIEKRKNRITNGLATAFYIGLGGPQQ